MSIQPGLRVHCAFGPWTLDFADTLRVAGTHWYSAVQSAIETAPTVAASRFLEDQVTAHPPLDLAEYITVTLPGGIRTIKPDSFFNFRGYDAVSRTVIFRWLMTSAELELTAQELNLSLPTDTSNADDSIFVLVSLNGEPTAPATLMVMLDREFTTDNLLTPEEMRGLCDQAGL